jgi:glycosyltransferase involved in cell wall biosynthesis
MDVDFSVIVPACSEAPYLEWALQSVRNQDFGGQIELIVVDNSGSADAGNIARRYADLVLYATGPEATAAARQRGARRARGNNLVFLDANTELSPNLLAEAGRSLQAGYVGGRAPLCLAAPTLRARLGEAVLNHRHRFIGPTFAPYLYCTRDVFQRAGGWELHITGGDEVHLQRRMHAFGRLAWNVPGYTTTHARHDQAEGGRDSALATFFGINRRTSAVAFER